MLEPGSLPCDLRKLTIGGTPGPKRSLDFEESLATQLLSYPELRRVVVLGKDLGFRWGRELGTQTSLTETEWKRRLGLEGDW